jgi:hypothetical protein
MESERRVGVQGALDVLVPLSLIFMFLSGVQFIFISIAQVLFSGILRADLFMAVLAAIWALVALIALYASFLMENE